MTCLFSVTFLNFVMRGWSYNVLYVYRRTTNDDDDDDDDDNYDPVQSILIIFSKLFVNDHKRPQSISSSLRTRRHSLWRRRSTHRMIVSTRRAVRRSVTLLPIKRLLRCRPTFSKSLMVSVAVSKLGCTIAYIPMYWVGQLK